MGSALSRDRRVVVGVCRWFLRAGRALPWRGRGRSGYAGLVSEAMLQQTQVGRVVERYRSFMRVFPSVGALAGGSSSSVLALWQGLGYYRRARHLHAAAVMVESEFGGRVPRTVDRLRRLPGVGRYSAGAIASIVYGRAEAMVDGNVARVLARLAGRDGVGGGAGEWAWSRSAELVGVAETPGVFNEGLMELGAEVCTPRSPSCGSCPLRRLCVAYRLGLQETIPAPRKAARRLREYHHAVVVRRGVGARARLLLERRPSSGMWADMWQVPTVEAGRVLPVGAVRAGLSASVTQLKKVASFEFGTTHRLITFCVYTARSRQRRGVWRCADDLGDLPMSNAQRRVLARAIC